MREQQIDQVESALKRIAAQMPEVPKEEMLIGRIIVLLAHDLSAAFARVGHPHGLTDSGFRVLTALFFHEDSSASPSELSAKVADSPANMTRITDGLVAQGLITRVLNEHDRRRMVLRITASGKALVDRLLPTFFGSLRRAFSGLSADEIKQTTARLKSVAVALDAMEHETSAEPSR